MKRAESFMLLFLSDFKWDSEKGTLPEEKEYRYQDSGKKYCGSQTNEAPVKCLLSVAHEEGTDISKILCILSKNIYHRMVPIIGCTAYQKFEEMVKQYAEKMKFRIPEVVPIFYDFQLAQGKEMDICEKERTGFLYKQIADAVHTMEYPSVYIDYTGGMRDVSFFMTGIIKYLEFDLVSCKKIIYSNWQTAVIYNINYIYDMFQLISGVEEFVTTGNARQLGMLFQQKKESPVHDILQAIINFSNSISLCRLSSMDDDIREINVNLDALKESSRDEEDVFCSMFYTLIPSIREKMSLDKIVKGNQIEYPFLIQWCIENGLIQQAITLYVEKMPYYYFINHKIPEIVDISQMKEKLGGDIYAEAFYSNLFEYYYSKGDEFQKRMCEFRKIVCRIKDNSSGDIGLYIKQIELEKGKNRRLKKALDKLEEFISTKYKDHKTQCIYGKEVRETTADKFFNQLCARMDYVHYFLVGDKNEFEDYKAASSGTYRKKIRALSYVRNQGDKSLCERMEYYFAVKLLRNRINHASEKEMTKDEAEAVEYLKGEGIDVTINYDSVVRLLKEANAINL